MLKLLLVMQLAAPDSVYTSPALRRFIAEAALANRAIPAALVGYRARLETDIAILLSTDAQQQRLQGTQQEHAEQLEQVESELRWQRTGAVDQHIVGYRSQTLGPAISLLSVLHEPWALPTLYGDRLQFIDIDEDDMDSKQAKKPAATIFAIHPLAADRDDVYAFSGGDTTVTLHLAGREIHIVRVHVEPRVLPKRQTLIFRGDLDLDADRKQIVRMRGEFVFVQAHQTLRGKLLSSALQSFIYADFVNGEVSEQFWLPTYQRLEIQVRSKLAANFTPVVRIVTRFRNHEVTGPTALVVPGDMSPARHRLTWSSSDTVNAFHAWSAEIGAEATAVTVGDFDDIAPDAWRTKGTPRLDWSAERTSDLLHFNRVEGLYTGVAARYRFRDAAPGLSLSAHAGWAWAEATARGAIVARLMRDGWRTSARIERALVNTNDFVPLLEGDATLSALIATTDDFDYVDRWQATFSAAHPLGRARGGLFSIEVGPGYDGSVSRNITHGLFHGDSLFRENRASETGGYMRETVALDLHPSISGEMLEPGIGAGISYTRGDGAVRWQRVEGKLIARHVEGAITYVGRFDAAAVFGGVPPQQVIEFGQNEGLPGYAYKQFGGNRAALLRAGAQYNLPFMRAPLRVKKVLVLPNLSPGVGASIQAGWADASSQDARDALALFGPGATVPTDGIRSTVDVFVTLFGGAIGFGIARPLDHAGRWSFSIGTGAL